MPPNAHGGQAYASHHVIVAPHAYVVSIHSLQDESPTVRFWQVVGTEGIRTPILLLVGDHEVIYEPKRVIQRASRAVAGLRAKIISNANHNAEYTAAYAVNKEIESFLLEQ
jgi:pimeloyl-ACP methyl ester carboxylesterase